MKYLKFSPIILALVFLLYYYFEVYQFRKQTSPPQNKQLEQSAGMAQKQWETKSDDQPPVTVKVTPVELGADRETWKFQIVFDTHSGSLDDDLLAVASLVDDKGNMYRSTVWEGPEPGGHHREGVLVFEAINPAPSYVELKIKNVGGIPERSFKWNLE